MTFGTNPVTGTQGTLPTNQFPLSSVAVPNHAGGNLTALRGANASTDANGNELADASMYIADGNNVAQGALADVAVVGDNSGTISAKLRGLSKIWNDVWDSVNHRIHVNVDNGNANGQTTMSASAPVAISSDQSPVAIKGGAATGAATPTNPVVGAMNGFNNLVKPLASAAIGANGVAIDNLLVIGSYVYSSGITFTADLLRTPAVFKTVSATASGNTAVWTPTTGAKFRLMRYKIEVTQNALISGGAVVITIQFQDSTTNINLAHSVFIPATAPTTPVLGMGWSSEWIDLGNGYLSTAINQVLNINISTALTSGNVRVIAIGTEE